MATYELKPFSGDFQAYRWVVAQVMAQKEFAVSFLLRDAGFEAIVPKRTVQVRVNRYSEKTEPADFPLINGYVIAGIPHGRAWVDVHRVGFVRGVVGKMMGRDRVPEYLRIDNGKKSGYLGIRHFVAQYGDGSFPAMLAPANEAGKMFKISHNIKAGDKVALAEGPMEGVMVEVSEIVGDAATILLPLFGGVTSRSIPIDKLRA